MKHPLIRLIFLSLLLTLYSCATVSSPPGGEKDSAPPLVTKTYPDSAQTNFYQREVKFDFDEYFTLKNPNKEIIISPPFNELITTTVKGKTLILTFPDYPKINTTYQIHLGNAIADYNEGNILKNQLLIFSTGPYIDSLELTGTIKSSFDNKALEEMGVYLYDDLSDTAYEKGIPYYTTFTDSAGNFRFKHLKKGTYNIFAYQDLNSNGIIEMNEATAFRKTPVVIDTINNKIHLRASKHPNTSKTILFNTSETNKGEIQLTFNKVLKETPLISIQETNYTRDKNGYLNTRFGLKKDTVYTYFNYDSIPPDSIHLNISFDTSTVSKTIIPRKTSSTIMKLQASNNTLDPSQKISLISRVPILKTNTSKMKLYNISDSTTLAIDTTLKPSPFVVEFIAQMKPGKSYKLILDRGSITNYDGKTNESDTFNYNVTSLEQLGEIELNISIDSSVHKLKTNSQNIITRLYSSGKIDENTPYLKQYPTQSDTVIYIPYLKPGDYEIRSFLDSNKDETWTPGNFKENRLPEPFFQSKLKLNVRPNWENKNIPYLIK